MRSTSGSRTLPLATSLGSVFAVLACLMLALGPADPRGQVAEPPMAEPSAEAEVLASVRDDATSDASRLLRLRRNGDPPPAPTSAVASTADSGDQSLAATTVAVPAAPTALPAPRLAADAWRHRSHVRIAERVLVSTPPRGPTALG